MEENKGNEKAKVVPGDSSREKAIQDTVSLKEEFLRRIPFTISVIDWVKSIVFCRKKKSKKYRLFKQGVDKLEEEIDIA